MLKINISKVLQQLKRTFLNNCGILVSVQTFQLLKNSSYNAMLGLTAEFHSCLLHFQSTEMFLFLKISHNQGIKPRSLDFTPKSNCFSVCPDLSVTKPRTQGISLATNSHIAKLEIGITLISSIKEKHWICYPNYKTGQISHFAK